MNQYYKFEEPIQLNEHPTINDIFELNSDQLTKIKQTIISIPYMNYVIQDHYREIMEVDDIQTMVFQLSVIKKRIASHQSLDLTIKAKLYATFCYYINEFLENCSYQNNPLHFTTPPIQIKTEFPLVETPFKPITPVQSVSQIQQSIQPIQQMQSIQQIQSLPQIPQIQPNTMMNQSISSIPIVNYQRQSQIPPYQLQLNSYIQPDYMLMNMQQNQQLQHQKQMKETNEMNQYRKTCLSKLPKATPDQLGKIVQFIDPESFDLDIELNTLNSYQLLTILHILDPKNYKQPIKQESESIDYQSQYPQNYPYSMQQYGSYL